MQLAVLRYRPRGAAEPTPRILCSYAILHGGRGGLVEDIEEPGRMAMHSASIRAAVSV